VHFTSLSLFEFLDDKSKDKEHIKKDINWTDKKEEINSLFEKLWKAKVKKPEGIMELLIKKECIKELSKQGYSDWEINGLKTFFNVTTLAI
jgi:hypothetical protein